MPANTNPAPTKARQKEKGRMHKPAQTGAGQHQGSGADANLSFNGDGFCPAHDRQAGGRPGIRATFHHQHFGRARHFEFAAALVARMPEAQSR